MPHEYCLICRKNAPRTPASAFCAQCINRRNASKRTCNKKFRYEQHCRSVATRGRRPLPFADWVKFWQKPCTWCGAALRSISIDRIDNARGYTPENCQSLCRVCNTLKGRQLNERTLAHICAIALHNPEIKPRKMSQLWLTWGRGVDSEERELETYDEHDPAYKYPTEL